MLYGVWLPIALITALHYLTSHEVHHVHDLLRRGYYIPIVVAAFRLGLQGGVISASVVTAAYLPHAFFLLHHFDPARETEKILEILLYFSVGAIAGHLSDRERRQRERLEISLREQQQLADQLIRAGRLSALGETVAGIAHEIRNPLHAMAGTLEVIEPLIPADAEERPLWDIHRSEVARLSRVADRFLSFARPAESDMTDLDLRDVATRIRDLAAAQTRQSGIALHCDISEEPLPTRGDRDQLAQIGMNIVLNAQRVIGERGGHITIRTGTIRRNDRDCVYLAIHNDGPPIPTTEIESMFDPFHSSTGSTGLGLSISARIAAAHDGHIAAESSSSGVVFTLFLPLTSPDIPHRSR